MTTTGIRRVIAVPEELFQRIDEGRWEMERDEFIKGCLDSLISSPTEDAQKDKPRREQAISH